MVRSLPVPSGRMPRLQTETVSRWSTLWAVELRKSGSSLPGKFAEQRFPPIAVLGPATNQPHAPEGGLAHPLLESRVVCQPLHSIRKGFYISHGDDKALHPVRKQVFAARVGRRQHRTTTRQGLPLDQRQTLLYAGHHHHVAGTHQLRETPF